jgi:TPR repeat protein
LNNEKSQESDLSEAFSHLRQAARHGLEEARSALIILTNDVANQEVSHVTTILPAHAGERSLRCEESKHGLSARKALSEPLSFSYCNNANHTSKIINFEFNEGSVSFYFGD